jgi:probable phosphoglycerate mutase
LYLIILHLVRHAETIWHAENKYAGHKDIPLTELGHFQAQELKEWVVEIQPTAIYASDLIRAIDTARPLGDELGIEVKIDKRLREVNFGEIEGLSQLDMKEKYPELYKNYLSSPADTQMPGGESGNTALRRVWPFITEIVSQKNDQNVLLVSHGTLIRLITCELLGIELNKYRQIFPDIANTAKITIRISENSEGGRIKAGLLSLE